MNSESSILIEKEAIKREGRLFLILRPFMALFMIAVFILYTINPSWMRLCAFPFPIGLRWIGVVFGTLSLPLLIWVQQTLGRYWSTNLQLRKEHILITTGPYRWVRHPMYTALFTFFIAGSLISANWLFILLTMVVIVGLYIRIGKEEIMMIEKFGDEYRDYMKRTGRFLPRLIRSRK
ncbi:MAG: isoprenylcysteine carboxylmethyltransferase family protein [Bacteroidales bacterium]|nr:isoprenylcysteine carboxylmethyltransferase family protein [Bacteroidales bacterium]